MVFPTYNQAERAIWDGVTLGSNDSYLSYILAEEMIELKQPKKFRIQLVNGSIIQFVGSDKAGDDLRGSGISGAKAAAAESDSSLVSSMLPI